MIMNIENQTDKNITLTITAEFKDSKGNVLKTETRKVEGFPANYRNYVVFQPGIKFDKFTYEIKTSSFSGTTYAKCLAFDTETAAKLVACISKPGEGEYPKGQERAGISFRVRSANTYNTTLYVGWDEIFFDNKGNIYYIGEFGGAISNQFVSYKDRQCVFHDILFKDFSFPSELEGNLKVLNGHIRKFKKSKIDCLSFHLRKLEAEAQAQSKVSRKKETEQKSVKWKIGKQ